MVTITTYCLFQLGIGLLVVLALILLILFICIGFCLYKQCCGKSTSPPTSPRISSYSAVKQKEQAWALRLSWHLKLWTFFSIKLVILVSNDDLHCNLLQTFFTSHTFLTLRIATVLLFYNQGLGVLILGSLSLCSGSLLLSLREQLGLETIKLLWEQLFSYSFAWF